MRSLIQYLNDFIERRLMINPPRKILIIYWIVLAIVLFTLVTLSKSIILFITVPLFVIWFIFFLYFMRLWNFFRYSKLIAIIPLVLLGLSAFLLGPVIRGALLSLINSLLG